MDDHTANEGRTEGGAGTGSVGTSSRLQSLDALRGLAIVLMLLVNNFGLKSQTPAQFRHAGWEGGIRLADMAFPWFLFCIGLAIPFSVASFKKTQLPEWRYDLRVLRRTLVLLVLGAILDSTGDNRLIVFSVGILQTLAIAYAISALLYDLPVYRRAIIALVVLIAYWAFIKYVPAPGMRAGTFSEDQNIFIYFNRHFFGPVGLWGLLRLVPTTALTLIGTGIGDLLRFPLDPRRRMKLLLLSGLIMTVASILWSYSLPFNKPIWTSSYIVFSAGTGTLILGTLYWLIDIKMRRFWAYPLVVFGSNAIIAYVMPILFKGLLLRPLGIYVGGWFRVTLFITFWWFVLWLLYRKKIFLKV